MLTYFYLWLEHILIKISDCLSFPWISGLDLLFCILFIKRSNLSHQEILGSCKILIPMIFIFSLLWNLFEYFHLLQSFCYSTKQVLSKTKYEENELLSIFRISFFVLVVFGCWSSIVFIVELTWKEGDLVIVLWFVSVGRVF